MATKIQQYLASSDFIPTEQSSLYTATARDLVLADTSGGAFTVNLPATPSAGDRVVMLDSKESWSSNNLTIGRNGSNIDGAASDYTADGSSNTIELIYSGDATVGWVVRTSGGGSGGGSNEVTIYPQDMKLDDTATGADAGTFADIFDTVDFSPDNDGAVWGSFRLPGGFSEASDVNVELNYALSGSDDGKTIKLTTDYWAVAEGNTPAIGSPDESNTDDITSAAGNTGKYYSGAANVLSAATVGASDETIVFRITRDADNASDTYTGTLQLISVKFSQ
jgi:hypothetical protein